MNEKILITAFGAFGEFRENPSARVLQELQAQNGFCEKRHISCEVLPVSYHQVKAFVDRVRADPPSRLLHLGVAAGADRMRLELRAVNEARGLDVDGVDPEGAPLCDGERELRSTVSRDTLAAFQEVHSGSVQFSEDAGRYLCNGLYYLSLHQIGWPLGVPCLFVHVADPRTGSPGCSIAEQTETVRALVEWMRFS